MSLPWAAAIEHAAEQAAKAHRVALVRVPGWEWRGHGTTNGLLRGTMWHDTITPYSWSDAQLARLLRDGYEALPGPIANVGIGSTGTILLIAAGRAYHAGAGKWDGIPSGNLNACGLEVQNPGRPTPWRHRQLAVSRTFTAELHRKAGLPSSTLVGHKEWAPTRKQDPWSVNMAGERAILAGELEPIEEVEMPLTDGDVDRIAQAVNDYRSRPDRTHLYNAALVAAARSAECLELVKRIAGELPDSDRLLAGLEGQSERAELLLQEVRVLLDGRGSVSAEGIVDELVRRLSS